MLDILPVHSTWNLMSNMTSLCSVAVLSSSAFCSCCLGQSLLGPMWPNGLQKNTMQHHGTQWNTCYYYFFNQSITVIHILYILSIFLFDQKGQGFWFHVAYILCVCVRVLLLFLFVLRLLIGGIVVAGPPCSLHIAASQSVHQRSLDNLMGNTRNMRVRLSKLIWINFVRWLHWKNDLVSCSII